ncbi:helix-turn-helix transcriptional regulator [Mammaliicoccus sciuri]
MLSQRLKSARNRLKLTQEELATKVNTTKSTISNYENGHSTPSNEMLVLLCEALHISTDYLLGRTNTSKSDGDIKLPELTQKDERDIAKVLENMLNALDSKDRYAAFDGRDIEDIYEEDRELLKASLENSLRLAKRMEKQKFTPKKI